MHFCSSCTSDHLSKCRRLTTVQTPAQGTVSRKCRVCFTLAQSLIRPFVTIHNTMFKKVYVINVTNVHLYFRALYIHVLTLFIFYPKHYYESLIFRTATNIALVLGLPLTL